MSEAVRSERLTSSPVSEWDRDREIQIRTQEDLPQTQGRTPLTSVTAVEFSTVRANGLLHGVDCVGKKCKAIKIRHSYFFRTLPDMYLWGVFDESLSFLH